MSCRFLEILVFLGDCFMPHPVYTIIMLPHCVCTPHWQGTKLFRKQCEPELNQFQFILHILCTDMCRIPRTRTQFGT